MKVLFIGGTGKISSAVTPLAAQRGFDMYLLNRGQTDRPIPDGVKVLHGDIRDKASAAAAIEGHTFDVVVDWIAFTPDQVQLDLDLFKGKVGQYIFISSASAYQTPPATLPEDKLFLEAWRSSGWNRRANWEAVGICRPESPEMPRVGSQVEPIGYFRGSSCRASTMTNPSVSRLAMVIVLSKSFSKATSPILRNISPRGRAWVSSTVMENVRDPH